MRTYTQLLYQIVFCTKHRQRTLSKENRKQLFRYIWGILKNKNCFLYQINGVADHLHIVTHIPPSLALASLVKDIKVASSGYIRKNDLFPDFAGWQQGYAAFTYSMDAKEGLIEYVKNQEAHHSTKTFNEELITLLLEFGVAFDDQYLD